MKRIFLTIFAITATVALTLQYSFIFTHPTVPPPGHTGSPVDGKTCATSGCHAGTAQQDMHSVTVLLIGTSTPASGFNYVPGTQYNMVVNLNGLSKPRYGFQLSALDDSNNQAGSFAVTGTSTALNTLGNIQYISHNSNPAGTAAWVFKWTAPATDVGPINFYLAANGSNNDNTSTGDAIVYRRFRTSDPTSVKEATANPFGVKVYPALAQNNVQISFALSKNADISVDVLDMQGRTVLDEQLNYLTAGHQKHELNVQDLQQGAYLVRLTDGEKVQFSRFIKSN